MSARSLPIGAFLRDALQTAFRLVPWPTEPGLRSSGNPGRESPVIITGNYDLTVRRVLRALKGVDAWLVVAPSSGINVWCAASGGHLGTHQVVTALKTSGIEDHVSHHRAILPQLAATGVLAREVSRRCGWKLRFGPVRIRDLPEWLANGEKKTEEMRRVRWGAAERLEMAAMWGIPSAIVVGGGAAFLRAEWSLPLAALAISLAVAVFGIYDRIPGPRRLILGAVAMIVSVAAVGLSGGGLAALVAGAGASLFLTGVVTFDYTGSTPVEGGSHFEERKWHITLDLDRCKGVYNCFEVCPEACYEKREDVRKVHLAHDDRCVRCGACVVQCPQDALYFEDEEGRRIEPDSIRRFKLNLMGRRAVDAGPPPPPEATPVA
jgi:NAD-dependent dihydropyrimidine dehydrogenase PreA subunit